MRKTLVLLFLCLLQSITLYAGNCQFEKQLVILADGSESLLWICLDEKIERLNYKLQEQGEVFYYKASDVVSFQYGGNNYYSLPLGERYFTFFKVYHEGAEYAILEKIPNYNTLRLVAEESEGKYSVCQDKRDHELTLCFIQYYYDYYGASLIPGSPMSSVSRRTRKFEVYQLVYLAIEGKLKLFYMDTDERFNFWDNLLNSRPGLHKVEDMLEDFIPDQQKVSAIKKKVKKDKLDIRQLDQLVRALEEVYH